MRERSHISLGYFLLDRYLPELTEWKRRAFLIGCIQPDKNPATYLKGSIHSQWMRGHNYNNAQRFIFRIAHRLEKKETFNIFDYYTLGKLIHYTADAFTYAHNEHFPKKLTDHRKYEARLQVHFLKYISNNPQVTLPFSDSVEQEIRILRQNYIRKSPDIYQDSYFVLQACCCVLSILFILKGKYI